MERTRPRKAVASWIAVLLLLVLGLTHPGFAQQAETEPTIAALEASEDKGEADNEGVKSKSGHEKSSHLGGPKSVGAQIKKDDRVEEPVFKLEGLERGLKPYFDFKSRVNEKYALTFGIDYNALFQAATKSLGEDTAAGGVLRFYGRWTLLGSGSENTGTLVYKAENRHRLGTDIAPKQLGPEVGYAGQTAVTFSDAGWLLTNFFWEQDFLDGRAAFLIGLVDTTDYVDTYGLVNNWTDFSNLAFSTDPTIPAPNQGLGAAVWGTLTNNVYVLAGLADANGDPGDPLEGFNTFFGDHEYFKHIEVGWFSSWKRRFEDNIHLTAWHADKRSEVQVPDGWGLAFSFNHLVDDRWLPFARLGYADGGGGALLERSVSMGLGYHIREKSDLIALGLNWGRPSEETFGPGLKDQYTAELFYRLLLLKHLTITPDVQLLINPALNPDEDLIWVVGLRVRADF